MLLRLGTRASPLARWQAQWVAARLAERHVEVETVLITTSGDRRQEVIGTRDERGLFTKEIQRAMLEGRIDLAVHSLKDLPTEIAPELYLAAVPERAPPGDALICGAGGSLAELPPAAAVATGSPRRRAQLLHFRPDLRMRDIRGNVDTRLRKLDEGGFDALVLAEAGLRRLGLADRITQPLPLEIVLPAAGQGALALETRADDAETRKIIATLDHPPTHAAVLAERTLLAMLEGGCLAPVATLGSVDDGRLTLVGRVLSLDGRQVLETRQSGWLLDAESIGRRVAETLLADGAGELVRASRA